MIKLLLTLLVVLIILALIGGAIEFKATDEDWTLITNKEVVMSSIQNGAVMVYDFVKQLITNANLTAKN